ncbi:MAG: hypothetical protein JNL35_16145 [Sphingopyxis sp.]|nr:hypothetical protein [Sphingopyxis sp.]
MRRFTALELIEIGESGASLGPAGRGLLLLTAGGWPRDAAEALPVGARDWALFALREAQFGARMEVAQACTDCGEAMEYALTAADLRRDAPAGEGDLTAIVDGVRVRAINAGDLAACERAPDTATARKMLRALVAPDGAAIGDDRLDTILANLDTDAELDIAAACPACGEEQPLAFDVAAFFWDELALRVPRLLDDVADLAHAFHWTEADILGLPAARRNFYLSRVRA